MFKLFREPPKEEEIFQESVQQNNHEQHEEAPDVMFRFTVDSVFAISGRGTVATGTIERGTVKVGDTMIFRGKGIEQKVQIHGIEKFRETPVSAEAGDYVGLQLMDISKEQITVGDTISGS